MDTAHADGRFQKMAYFYAKENLPASIVAPGFQKFTNIGGRIYLVKDGRNYRLDRLVKTGRARLVAA
jgi:hypothetical protein